MGFSLIKITWPFILYRSHGILSYQDHMAFYLIKITWHFILSRSHGILSYIDHMAYHLIKITWYFILSTSHGIFLGPLFGTLSVFLQVSLVQPGYLRYQGVIRVGVTQH